MGDNAGAIDWIDRINALPGLVDAEKAAARIMLEDCAEDKRSRYLRGPDSITTEVIKQLLSGAGKALPLVYLSSSALARKWMEAQGVFSRLSSLIGQIDGDSFNQLWTDKGSQLRGLSLSVRPCVTEQAGEDPYHDGGAMVEAISRVLLPNAGTAYVFYNKGCGIHRTRPDVAWCGLSQSVQVLPGMLYGHLKLALEYKTTNALKEGANGLNSGIGQIISRAGEALREQGLSSIMLPGAVTDNLTLVPVIVETSLTTGHRLLTTDCPFFLTSDRSDTRSLLTRIPVDTQSAGFKELVHLCWAAARGTVMRAAADPREEAGLEEGSTVAVLSSGGGCSGKEGGRALFRVLKRLSLPTPSGCAYGAAPCQENPSLPVHAGPQVVVKVGPPADLAAQARQLHLPSETWGQVPREIETLVHLKGLHALESLPELLAHGVLDVGGGGGGQRLQGVPVVVTRLLGEALVGPGQQGPEILLPDGDVERLMWDIFEALAVLQALGIRHGDVHPGNLGRRVDGGFYLFDFGSATTPISRAAGSLTQRPPCSLLFSSVEVLLGGMPGQLADATALIFCGLVLAGLHLPWSSPAAAGDLFACVKLKVDFMSDPVRELPAWASLLSPEMRRLAEEVMRCALGGREDGSLTEMLARWVAPDWARGHRPL